MQQVVNAAKQRENQAQSSQTGIERTKAAQLFADAQVDVGIVVYNNTLTRLMI